MANYCSVDVVITGHPIAINDLYNKIDQQDPELIKESSILESTEQTGNEYGLHTYQRNGDSEITLAIGCKNSPLPEPFIDLSSLYPTLTIDMVYSETANQLYGKDMYKGGYRVEEIVYIEERWRELHDEDYIYEKKQIAELPYEEFLEEYAKWGGLDDEPKYISLGKDIIARIKDDDLPLFINVDWYDDAINQQYKDRYSTYKETPNEHEAS